MIKTKKETKKLIGDLTLVLSALTGWQEESKKNPGGKIYRTWKGYKFEVTNELEDQKLIQSFPGYKSMLVTPNGLEKAQAIIDDLGL